MRRSSPSLTDMVTLRPRFLRSVHLERDFHRKDAADGYLVTRGTRSAFSLLTRGIGDPSYRAQCISGPYGSGKSALALFFARLMEKEQHNGLRPTARQSLGPIGEQLLPADGEGYVTILATGTRESISACLARSLKRSLEMSGRQRLLNALSRKHSGALNDPKPSTRQVVALFEDLARLSSERESAQGVIVIVDELGKLLEHAALQPEDSDVQVLQELAEASSRSHETPMWFVTILHQQFSQYASRLGRSHQREWARVQQRFFDVPCVLDGLDALQLSAAAIGGAEASCIQSNRRVREVARKCAMLAPRGSEEDFETLCVSCYPLHPTVVLLLPSIFRRFGQNERSLFSFLSADEPFSLTNWMQKQEFAEDDPPFVRLPHLYDYTLHTLIGGAPSPQIARMWLEAEDALARLGDAAEPEVHTLKAISLLNLVGDASRLPASRDILELALTSPGVGPKHLGEILDTLKVKRLLVYRRFRNAYRLSEGSDIDIGERLAEAYQNLPTQSVALSVAKDLCPAPPFVARKHSYLKGMLRLFSVIPSSFDGLEAALAAKDEADGHVICCLVDNDEQAAGVAGGLGEHADCSSIVMVAVQTDQLAEAARDVTALEWVKNNTPSLAGDRVARQELEERRLEASMAFRSEWNRIFTPGLGKAAVYWKGELRPEVASSKALTELVSTAADETFPYAPTIQNELINRRNLSSAAAAARRNLIEAMVLHSDEERLGLTGYPPERSIYESVLKNSGIHRLDTTGRWELGRPNDDPGLQEAWDHILEVSHSATLQPISLASLFSQLSDPPFGIADGFVPVLFYACLHANSATMALYEDSRFVPKIELPVLERMMRNPGSYSVVRFDIDGERAAVVKRLAKGFQVDDAVLPVVRSLYAQMGSLTRYAEITKSLSEDATAVRDAILGARSPERLLFLDLPKALGCQPFESDSAAVDKTKIKAFFDSLSKAFKDLDRCYPNLLEQIRSGLLKIFDISQSDAEWRDVVCRRATEMSALVTDPALRTLISRIEDTTMREEEYLESVGQAIAGQPPSRWSRAEEEAFAKHVRQLTAKARAVESLLDMRSSLNTGEAWYLLTVDAKQQDAPLQRPVHLSEHEMEEAERIAAEIADKYGAKTDSRILIAAVAEAARQVILSESENSEDKAQRGESIDGKK